MQGFLDAIVSARAIAASISDEGLSSDDVAHCTTAENSDGGEPVGDGSCALPAAGLDPSADVPVMVSGAGHDAMAIAEIAKMGMLFVRCRGGVSHSPLEHVEPADVSAAAAALYMYILARG